MRVRYLAGATLLLVAASALAQPARWAFQVSQDPMTDATQAAARIRSNGAALVLSCDSTPPADQIHAEVNLGTFVGSGSYPVAYRVDGGTPVTNVWPNTFNGRDSTVFPNRREHIVRFVDAIENGTILTIQAQTYQSNARGVVKIIELGEIRSIIARLRSTCLGAVVKSD